MYLGTIMERIVNDFVRLQRRATCASSIQDNAKSDLGSYICKEKLPCFRGGGVFISKVALSF